MSNLQSNKFIELNARSVHKGVVSSNPVMISLPAIITVVKNCSGCANISVLEKDLFGTIESYEDVVRIIKDAQA